MSKALALKLGLIGALLLVLLVPLGALRGLVLERQQRAAEVVEEIAASSSREQTLLGPVLLVKGHRTIRLEQVVAELGATRTAVDLRHEPVQSLGLPARLEIDAELATERRGRGVFTALLYHGEQRIVARIEPPPPPAALPGQIDYRVEQARLLLGLGDSRGVRGIEVEVNGRVLAVEPGMPGLADLREGLYVPLPAELLDGTPLDVVIALDLSGIGRLAVAPLGDETQVRIKSDWPHPGFSGAHLPIERDMGEKGFSARWQVSRLSSGAQRAMQACLDGAGCAALGDTALSVRLVEPVDRYLMTERALKYSLLLLVVVFGMVFFVEALRGVVVHPLQYGLTGLALAVFFLLLLALAEHVGFGWAYLAAALACNALIAVYMEAVLGGRRRGWAFAGLLGVLHGLLYLLLQSEDFALLLGATGLFALLATVMLATRRLDWSQVGRDSGR